MQGFEKPDGFLSVAALAPGLVGKDSVFGCLAGCRDKIFPPEMIDPMFAPRCKAGQPSVPGPVMCSVLLLQALFGLSDRATVDMLTYDLRWKAACGFGIDQVGFHHTTLAYWRFRIAASDNPRLIFDAVTRIVDQCGVIKVKHRRVVDSTIIDDAVARQDTYKLLIWQIAKIGEDFPQLAPGIDHLPGGGWYRERLRPDIDWTSKGAKNDLVSVLVNDALTVVGWAQDEIGKLDVADPVRGFLEDEVGLLGVLAGQDVEPAPGSDGTDGRWRIATKTARDRIVSVVDTQTRHIRKTSQNKHDGFKAHMVAEPDTGLVVASLVSKGCGDGSSDAACGIVMVGADPGVVDGSVVEVQGDSAYGSAAMLAALDKVGVEAVIKPRPLLTAVEGGYSLDDFQVNGDGTITCPGGYKASRDKNGRASFTSWCLKCPLRPNCTKAKKGRVVVIKDEQLRLRRHRVDAADNEYKTRLRQYRPMAERSIAWLTRAGRRSPYRGIMKTDAWWGMRAAGVNLKRLLALGLVFSNGAWVLVPPG